LTDLAKWFDTQCRIVRCRKCGKIVNRNVPWYTDRKYCACLDPVEDT